MVLLLLPICAYAAAEGNPSVSITDGSVILDTDGSDNTYTVGGTTKTYTGTFTITGDSTASSNTITVQGGTHDITLQDVVIDSDSAIPLSITGGTANVTLTGENKFGTEWDGVYATNIVLSGSSALVIGGEGSLYCNESLSWSKMDIGNGCIVTVNSGTVDLRTTNRATVTGQGTLIINEGLVRLRSHPDPGPCTVLSDETNVIVNGGRLEQYEWTAPWNGKRVTVNGGVLDTNGVAMDAVSFAITGGTVFASSITDTSGQSAWNGIVFEGDTGTVYGNPTCGDDITVPSGKTLTIGSGHTLTIAEGTSLTVNGSLAITGTLINNGTVYNGGHHHRSDRRQRYGDAAARIR